MPSRFDTLLKNVAAKAGRSADEVENAFKGQAMKGGSNSFIADGLSWLYRKVTPGPSVQKADKYKNFVYNYKKKLKSADMAAGEVAQKTPLVGRFFKSETQIPLGKAENIAGNEAVRQINVQTPSLVAPLEKAKDVALPFMGAAYLGDKMINKKKKNQEVGEPVMHLAGEKGSRDILIKKIAKELEDRRSGTGKDQAHQNEQVSGLIEKVALAAQHLKTAASMIKDKDLKMQKTAEERDFYKLQVIAMGRSRRSVKLAQEMLDKGLIKKAELTAEVDKIMEMDDKAFEAVKDTVYKAPTSKVASEGLTTSAFMLYNDNEESVKKTTLAEAIQN